MLDLDRYRNDGYLLVPGLVDEKTCGALKIERERFAKTDAKLSVELQLVHRSRTIRDFAVHGPQVPLAVEVLGPNVCFTHQQFVSKAANSGDASDIPWHQDSGYGRLEPPTDLTVWIALDDTDEDNGCLEVIPGSQRPGLEPHHPRGSLVGADVDQPGVAVPMAAGDALLFSGHLMHRSAPNRTGKARHAMYLRYCTPDVTMVSAGNKPVLEDGYSWMVAGEAD
jgi:ectoine hydroxylase-related dioxygenase (phytanoyl-CoA dioxygenase family)